MVAKYAYPHNSLGMSGYDVILKTVILKIVFAIHVPMNRQSIRTVPGVTTRQL